MVLGVGKYLRSPIVRGDGGIGCWEVSCIYHCMAIVTWCVFSFQYTCLLALKQTSHLVAEILASLCKRCRSLVYNW